VLWVSGGLGILITVLDGMLHLNQYQQNCIAYRSTCESLKHEKYVYIGKRRLMRAPRIDTFCWRKELSLWFRRNT